MQGSSQRCKLSEGLGGGGGHSRVWAWQVRGRNCPLPVPPPALPMLSHILTDLRMLPAAGTRALLHHTEQPGEAMPET